MDGWMDGWMGGWVGGWRKEGRDWLMRTEGWGVRTGRCVVLTLSQAIITFGLKLTKCNCFHKYTTYKYNSLPAAVHRWGRGGNHLHWPVFHSVLILWEQPSHSDYTSQRTEVYPVVAAYSPLLLYLQQQTVELCLTIPGFSKQIWHAERYDFHYLQITKSDTWPESN